MKVFTTFICLFLCVSAYAQPSFCLRLSQVSNDGSSLVVRIEIQGSVSFQLGSSNLQFSYNDQAIDKPILESSPLAPPFYQVPTLTVPSKNQLSFNIELGFPGFGTAIAATGAWTEVGRIKFDIIDFTQISELTWTYNGGTTATVLFLDDEATQIFATSSACLLSMLPTSTPLPGDLVDFYGRANESDITLNWIVENEVNRSGYKVFKSIDGRNWEKLGWVKAKEQTYNTYKIVDPTPFSPYNYYKLEMMDYDGVQEDSPIIVIPFAAKIISIYPNPAQEYVTLSAGDLEGDIHVQIYDANERLILNGKSLSSRIDISSFPSGKYLLLIQGRYRRYMGRFIKA